MSGRILDFKRLTLRIPETFFSPSDHGRENIPTRGGFILAPNHVSYLDPPATGSACPKMVYFMAKEELFTTWPLKHWIRRMGCIPVKHGASDRAALKRAVELLKSGKCVCIFPEGMRVPPGMVKEAEPGIVMVAEMAQVPVIPMAILGTQPWTQKIFGIIPWFSKVEARIGKPIFLKFDYDSKHRKEAYKKIAADIMDHIRKLKAENPS